MKTSWMNPEKRCDPFFKPDWAPEHLLSACTPATCWPPGERSSSKPVASDWDSRARRTTISTLRLADRTSRIEHIARILDHWRKSPESAAGSGIAKPWAIEAGRRALEDYVRRNTIDAVVLPGPTPGRYRVRRAIGTRPSVSIIVGAFDNAASRASPAALIDHLESTGLAGEDEIVACVEAGGTPGPPLAG